MSFQRTLQKSASLTGVGLHSGQIVKMTIKPAKPNSGIVFIRTDLPESPKIQAHLRNVVNTQLATTLGIGKVTIATVEHLMAAFQGMCIDNAIVEVSGSEVPIMDGSSAPFCELIENAGIETQRSALPILVLRRKVELKVAEKWAVAEPSSRLEVHGSIEWDHPVIGFQEYHYIEGKTRFSELASARTFCFLRDIEMMKQMGLARGGSLDNAVVMDETQVLNQDGLRFADEFARHKVLDALGDLKLAGISIRAFIRMHRAGHDLHKQLLTEIFSDENNYEIIGGVEQIEEVEQVVASLGRRPRYAAV